MAGNAENRNNSSSSNDVENDNENIGNASYTGAGNAAADAADSFIKFGNTIDRIVEALNLLMAEAGVIGMEVNPLATEGMNPADFAYQYPGEEYLVAPNPVDAITSQLEGINESIDSVDGTANNALEQAKEALTTAKKALSQANSAYNQANSALASGDQTPPNRSVEQSDAESPF